jgi:hypothetical protein
VSTFPAVDVPTSVHSRRSPMADLVFLAVTGLFFAVTVLVLKAVERL